MFGFIKKLLKYIMMLGVVLAIILGGMFLFLKPSSFKQEIVDVIQGSTGYKVEIKGAMDWSFKPEFVLHINDMTLGTVAEAKTVHIYLDPYSIFSDNLIVNKLEINNLTSTLNFNTLDKGKPSKRQITILELKLDDATLMYKDEETAQHWNLNKAQISTKNISINPMGRPEDFKVKGQLTDLDSNLSMSINAIATIDIDKQNINLDPMTVEWEQAIIKGRTLIAQFSSNPTISGEISLEALNIASIVKLLAPEADNQQATPSNLKGLVAYRYTPDDLFLEFTNFDLQIDDGSLKGNLQFTMDSPAKLDMNVALTQINMQAIYDVLALNITNPVDFFKDMSMNAKITGNTINFGNTFLANSINADITADAGQIQVNPITLSAYGGNHNCSIAIDLTKVIPTIKFTEQTDNSTLEPWLKLFNLPNTITGSVQSKIALEATGNNLTALKQSAIGSINLLVRNGSIFGLDLDKLLQYVANGTNDVYNQLSLTKNPDPNNLVKLKVADWMSSQTSNPITRFDALDLKNNINAGVVSSTINMGSVNYMLKGDGKFTSADNKVNYSTKVTTNIEFPNTLPEITSYQKQTPLPLNIGGTLDKLSFSPDLQNYCVTAIKQAQEMVIKKAVTKMVDAAGPSQKTSKKAEELFLESLQGLK